MARKTSLMVGIDFGTTYSGAAWQWSQMPESGDVVKTWPGIEGLAESSKVPTQIYYEGNNIKWGFNIPAGKKPLRWFKLLLLREEDLKPPYIDTAVRNSAYIKETKEMLSKLHKSAEDVVADYLGLLWKTVLEAIRTVLGAAMDGQPLRVVLTFPAIWPVYAQHRMKAAAETAGILDPRIGAEPTKLHLCAEPEAAALAVMHDANGQPVESGEVFVICDVGGGTADLITYELEDTETWELAERAPGAGKLCGALFVDEAFDRKMPELVGSDRWASFDISAKRIWIEETWERGLKRKFTGADPEIGLRIPLELEVMQTMKFKLKLFSRRKKVTAPPIQNHELRLPANTVASIFDGSVKQIVALVLEQVQKTRQRIDVLPKAVFLVGGFGQSPYLFIKIRDAVQSQGIEVRRLPGDKAWTAVCRGALIRAALYNTIDNNGITRGIPNITTRVIRASYGIEIIEEFDPNIHTDEDKGYVGSLGKDMAVKQMNWYIYNNQDIADREVIVLDWSRKINQPMVRNRFEVKLLKCDLNVPPPRKDSTVVEAGRIQCIVPTPYQQLPTYTNANGDIWKNIDFQVEMKVSGTVLEFAAYYNGHRQRPLHVSPPLATGSEQASTLLLPNVNSLD